MYLIQKTACHIGKLVALTFIFNISSYKYDEIKR